MSRYLLVSGGCERKNGYELGEGKYYERARLLKLDLESGRFDVLLEKDAGGVNYPEEHPNLQYTALCVDGDTLWLPTDTEVYKYRYPEMDLLDVYSYPFFHNIHSVNAFGDRIYVTSTGLDLVAVLNREGDLVRLLHTDGKDLWHRFSPDTDYRLVHSTRPHDCHPNFVYELNGEPWVTRCRQQDAVRLDRVDDRIELTLPEKRVSVHDGVVYGDKVYFTSVDGYVIVVDPNSKRVIEEIDVLRDFGADKLGWARGLAMASSDLVYLAFSRLRRTRMKEKLAWLAKGQISKMGGMPACVLAYDVARHRVLRKFDVPLDMLDAIYGIALVEH